jgi:hypothetical protein
MDLDEYKWKNKLTNQQIASSLGCSITYLVLMRKGIYFPSKKLMERIIDFTHGEVTADTFFREQINKWKKQATTQSQRELVDINPSTHIQPVLELTNVTHLQNNPQTTLSEVSNE